MPKELTHCLFADRALAGYARIAGGPFAATLARHRTILHMGAVSVDTFFYAMTTPGIERPMPNFGDAIHGANGEDTASVPLAMLDAARASADPDERAERVAFAAGFLTHVALDATLHPFVYNATGNYYAEDETVRESAVARHRLLESWLDLYVLAQAGRDRRTNGLFAAIRDHGAGPRLRAFYAAAIDLALGGPEPALRTLRRGWAIQSFANRLFPIEAAGRAAAWINRLAGRKLDDYLALFYDWRGGDIPAEIVAFESFRHPLTGARIAGGIDRLLSEAEALAVRYLAAVEAFVSSGDAEAFRTVVQGVSLDTGLRGARSRDVRHFDLIPDARLWPGGVVGG